MDPLASEAIGGSVGRSATLAQQLFSEGSSGRT